MNNVSSDFGLGWFLSWYIVVFLLLTLSARVIPKMHKIDGSCLLNTTWYVPLTNSMNIRNSLVKNINGE